MCGIAGIYNFNDQPIEQKILHQLDETISHRGPDGHGEFIARNIGLANRRLAIIDLSSKGNQPMTTDDGDLVITFNGEIFNYLKLRRQLEQKGYHFRTNTDTEVILIGYKQYSEGVVKKLIGQFAFCIWDKKKDRFFLARDHLGVNPLYYAKIGETFLFASEVKAILSSGLVKKEIDSEALHHYLSIFCIPAPLTIFKQIKSLLPGFTLTVEKNRFSLERFWQLPIGLKQYKEVAQEEIEEKLKDLIVSSVSYAKVADVPVAAFLSGGIDSSLVVALLAKQVAKPIKTFSLWAEGGEAFDERKYSRVIAKSYNTDHNEFTITQKEVVDEFPKIVYFFDQPTGGSFETYFVSKMASGFAKVALSGLGGDELFAGYHSTVHQTKLLSNLYRSIPPSLTALLLNILNILPISSDLKKTAIVADNFLRLPNSLKKRLFLYYAFQEGEKKKLYRKSFWQNVKNYSTDLYFEEMVKKVKQACDIDQLANLDLNSYTRDDLLSGTNMTSMAHSLEVRVPLLDPRLVEFSATLPSEFKFRFGVSKYILKLIAKDWLPEEIINHKKTGFGLPRVKYMKGQLKPYIMKALSKQTINKRGMFNYEYIQQVLREFYNDPSEKMLWREHLRVWLLFIFEIWCRLYIDKQTVTVPSQSLNDLFG